MFNLFSAVRAFSRRMAQALPGFLLAGLLLSATVARATTVIPPSFAELVKDADAIHRGTVTAVEARRVEGPAGSGSFIKTFVTVSIERTLKGAAPAAREVTLEFLGGTVGQDSMIVTGMPKFAVGEREFVFVQKNGTQFCPLVAVMHGRYRVLRDEATAKEFVARDNGAPLSDTAEVGLPMTSLPAPVRAASAAGAIARALTPAAFESSITAELDRLEQRANPN
ncbi:MAG: hypothetical protein V4773_08120 [Verrucomicrobiota bacterium]